MEGQCSRGLGECSVPLTLARATPSDPCRHGQGWQGYDTKHDTKTGEVSPNSRLSCPARERRDREDTSEAFEPLQIFSFFESGAQHRRSEERPSPFGGLPRLHLAQSGRGSSSGGDVSACGRRSTRRLDTDSRREFQRRLWLGTGLLIKSLCRCVCSWSFFRWPRFG